MGACDLSENCSLWTAKPNARLLSVVLRGGRWRGGEGCGVAVALLLVVICMTAGRGATEVHWMLRPGAL